MRIGKIGVAVIGLIPFNVYGECTPAPDCASIGYTETSCKGSFIRCPFDTSKLFCTPCDSSFQYDCIGDNITGGLGSACDEKYVSCECSSSEYLFSNGECLCIDITPTDCIVGAIYYANGLCSNELISCQNPVGVVVKDNSLIMSLQQTWVYWSYGYSDITDLINIESTTTALNDYNGQSNTLSIVNTYGVNADTSKNAAVFCYNYSPIGLETTKSMWYLPAVGELYYYIYQNYERISSTLINKFGWGNLSVPFWTSNEQSTHYAWQVNVSTGELMSKYKYEYSTIATCFLTIN